MFKRAFRVVCAVSLLTLAGLALTGCGENGSGGVSTQHKLANWDRKVGYFDGGVVANYMQNKGSVNDYISIVFYEPGSYLVMFSAPPNHSASINMPPNFRKEITVNGGPREEVIRQYSIPDYVRVTIIRGDGKEEFHDME